LARRGGIEHGKEFELEGGPDAVLLLHGLTGSTFELVPVAQRLHSAGLRCLAPLMAGHGGAARDLAGVPWAEWVGKALRDLARLERARRTFVVGSSMGALVACALAHERPERVDGLALLAPALELRPFGKLAALLGRAPLLRRLAFPKRSGSDVSDPEMRRRNPCMDAVPASAVRELARLEAHVDRLLPSVSAPALVVQGREDHTVTVAGARRLAERIGSGPAPFVLLERSWHLVGIDVERDRCAEAAAEFLLGLPLPGRRPAPARGSRER
jgi:carboxylesterase